VTRINFNLSKHHRNVSSYVAMDMNRAEQASNITRRLSFGDGYVTANTGAVLGASGECRNSGDKNKSNSEEQSAHKRTSWASVRLQLICRQALSHQRLHDAARNALWMLPLKHP